MNAFNFLNFDRKNGITMVLDKGLPIEFVNDYLKTCGRYIDFVKFGWGTSAVQHRELVKEKINLYKNHGIKTYPGGTLFEVCFSRGLFDEYLEECKNLGFEAVEISNGSMDLTLKDREKSIKKAKKEGFIVLTEVGKKSVDKDSELSIMDRVCLINEDLKAGADYVIMEGRESGKSIGLFDKEGNVKLSELETLMNNVPISRVIFESPNKAQQVEFILKVGSDVNLGNIAYDEVISLETIRRGLRGDTFGINL